MVRTHPVKQNSQVSEWESSGLSSQQKNYVRHIHTLNDNCIRDDWSSAFDDLLLLIWSLICFIWKFSVPLEFSHDV